MEINKVIKQKIKERGYRQYQFAKLIGMDSARISDLVNRKKYRKLKILETILDKLDLYIEEKYRYTGDRADENIINDLKEIILACGNEPEFWRLCKEAQESLNEPA